jgi:hypothetical protein
MPRSFRSKSLAGGVVGAKRPTKTPERQTCLLRTLHCLPWTSPVTVPGAEWQIDPQSYGKRLAELRSDLRKALTDVQAHERDVAGPVKEGARLALEELEAGLRDMLQQIEQKRPKRKPQVRQRTRSR